jgi:hypothetical protein
VADLNLVVQVLMGAGLLRGTFLARGRYYRAYAVTQTTVLLLNLAMSATVIWPSTKQQVMPAFPGVFNRWYFSAPSIHAVLGITAESLVIFIAMVSTLNLLSRDAFLNWRNYPDNAQ